MTRVSLVISDVDGTLVSTDKSLSERNRAAVASLTVHGVRFSVVSSRPPFGLRSLSEELKLRSPLGAYNGGLVVQPDLKPIRRKVIPKATVSRTLSIIDSFDVDSWLFTEDFWALKNTRGDYIDLEIRATGSQPKIINHFDGHLDGITKIVGVSADSARLDSCQQAVLSKIGGEATISRSQAYYLDITPAGVDKGTFVAFLAKFLGVPLAEVATIGDMENDLPMFRQSGFSIAMGNASTEVRKQAHATTLSNDQDGFADAVERLILPRARLATG